MSLLEVLVSTSEDKGGVLVPGEVAGAVVEPGGGDGVGTDLGGVSIVNVTCYHVIHS